MNNRSFRRNSLRAVGVSAAACIACCAGPIVAFLGGLSIAALASTIVIGTAGLVIAIVAATGWTVARRRAQNCAPNSAESISITTPSQKL